jgi:hypothetical protein
MENHQSSNRFTVEPAELGAAVAGLSFGAARCGTARLGSEADLAVPGGEGSSAAAADAIIRAEEEAAAAEAAWATVEAAPVVVEETVRPAVMDVVDVHASEASLCSSPEEATSGRGRVQAAVRNLESGVSAETVEVRYGVHDTSRGRAMEREIEQRRRRRARSTSCIDDVGARRPREEASDRERVRHKPDEWRMPAPLHRSQVEYERVERPGGHGYIPQFCPPPAFPTGLLGSAPAGGEGRDGVRRRRRRSRERAREDDRSTRRAKSRSPRRK